MTPSYFFQISDHPSPITGLNEAHSICKHATKLRCPIIPVRIRYLQYLVSSRASTIVPGMLSEPQSQMKEGTDPLLGGGGGRAVQQEEIRRGRQPEGYGNKGNNPKRLTVSSAYFLTHLIAENEIHCCIWRLGSILQY